MSLDCSDFEVPVVGSIPSPAYFRPFSSTSRCLKSFIVAVKGADFPQVLRIIANLPATVVELGVHADDEALGLDSFVFRMSAAKLISLTSLELCGKLK